MDQRYCLDASFFINGWQKYYRPEVFPAFWKKLDELISRKRVISCYEVYIELQRREDKLFAWAEERKHIFEEPDEATIATLVEIMKRFPNLAAKGASTRNAADPWLVAHAIQRSAIVVTDEQPTPIKSTKPPKIPTVCAEFKVKCMGIVDFLHANGICF